MKLQNYLKEKQELEKCSFYPNSKNPKDCNYQKLEETLNKLYQDSKIREQINHDNLLKKENEEDDKIHNKMTFRPELNKPLNINLFKSNNLIHEDKHVLHNIERHEKSRYNKKLKEIYLKNGISMSRDVPNIDELMALSEEPKGSFNLTIERKTFKDGFDNFNKSSGFDVYPMDNNYSTKKSKYFGIILIMNIFFLIF
jgi:hypothetical protein